MKIQEARQVYGAQISSYRDQLQQLQKQKEELEKRSKLIIDGKVIYEKEAAVLELTMDKVTKKKEEYQKYMEILNQQWAGIANMEASRQQADAAEEYYEDIGKIMEVARRIMKGGIVPPQDEKKLMEYSMELYQAAKNIGSMEQQKKREEYDSLWEEKTENKVAEDPMETANNAAAPAGAPAVIEVSEVMKSVAE
ncbi:MAG: hypothetical protein IKL51_07690 [Lachnospiraceae bacterium]|nr:hypothetical protein [Lachnospiraceae bacterium]